MIKFSAFLVSAYFAMTPSLAFAEEGYLHGEMAHKLEEGIYEAEHASKGGLPQFEPTWFASEIFWLAVSFAVLYFFFAKKTLPDISSVIENRKNHIQSDLESAEKLTAEADNVHETYQAGLERSQAKAAKAVLDVENDMKLKSAEAFDDFRLRSEKEVKASESRIVASKIAAMDEMNDIAAEAASIAVEKIIGAKTDVNAVKEIIEGMNGKAKAA